MGRSLSIASASEPSSCGCRLDRDTDACGPSGALGPSIRVRAGLHWPYCSYLTPLPVDVVAAILYLRSIVGPAHSMYPYVWPAEL